MENLLIPFLPGEVPDAEVILVVSPHPDDEVFGCGGAIMRHLQNGKQVNVVIISDGAFGTEGEEKVRRVAQRESESCKAAKKRKVGDSRGAQERRMRSIKIAKSGAETHTKAQR